ncbi:MAG: hypothetical protein IT452_14360 [Planctomycetia bacterium]|nr:hypothetical protein [Planctomycetia bacterium]
MNTQNDFSDFLAHLRPAPAPDAVLAHARAAAKAMQAAQGAKPIQAIDSIQAALVAHELKLRTQSRPGIQSGIPLPAMPISAGFQAEVASVLPGIVPPIGTLPWEVGSSSPDSGMLQGVPQNGVPGPGIEQLELVETGAGLVYMSRDEAMMKNLLPGGELVGAVYMDLLPGNGQDGGGKVVGKVRRKVVRGRIPAKRPGFQRIGFGSVIEFSFEPTGTTIRSEGCEMVWVNYVQRTCTVELTFADGSKHALDWPRLSESRHLDNREAPDDPPNPLPTYPNQDRNNEETRMWKLDVPHVTLDSLAGEATQAAAPFASLVSICFKIDWTLEAWALNLCPRDYTVLNRQVAEQTVKVCFNMSDGSILGISDEEVSVSFHGPPQLGKDVDPNLKKKLGEDLAPFAGSSGERAWGEQR